jgi:urease accessory protein
MTVSKTLARLGLVASVLAPATAYAHTGIGEASGFVHGFTHPVGGLDHILAMVAVGTFAAVMGGRAMWLVPTAFVAMMAFGGYMGVEGIELPLVEIGIAGSVVVLGLAVALRWSPPVVVAMGLVGVFAIFHGHAHGAEMPLDASGLGYAVGFMLATALLHAIGIALGLVAGRIGRGSLLASRAFGGAIALAGVGILAGWL